MVVWPGEQSPALGCGFPSLGDNNRALESPLWARAFFLRTLLWDFYHERGDSQGRVSAFLILSSPIIHLHHHPSYQVRINKNVLVVSKHQKTASWRTIAIADVILDKTSSALAKGILVYISKDKVKDHQEISGVKTSLQWGTIYPPGKLYQQINNDYMMVNGYDWVGGRTAMSSDAVQLLVPLRKGPQDRQQLDWK